MTHRAVVSGLGFVTSIGHSRSGVLDSLQNLRHGLSAWHAAPGGESNARVAGLLQGFDVSSTNPADWTWPDAFQFSAADVRMMPPHGVYALAAVQQALAEASLEHADLSDGLTGLHCASGGSPRMLHHHLNEMEKHQWRRVHPHAVLSSVSGSLNFHLGAHLGIRGSSCGFVSACSSGSHALGYALDEIRMGRQARMLVVAAEDLNAETALPFAGMGALSLQTDPVLASRPFDSGRDGFVPTGGAVALVLERSDAAERRGVRGIAEMLGWGQACDGHHAAAPHPDGRGLLAAMQAALRDASVAADEIGYINAHAPSTPAGDRAEARAITALMGRHRPAVSSTKALTGHGLSLAGAMEAAFCVLAIGSGIIPGQAHLKEPDADAASLELPRASLRTPPGFTLNNSSGFGGSNVSHVFAPLRS
jgi:3-oxoacyl-(acyl-carrier-protein) synthase